MSTLVARALSKAVLITRTTSMARTTGYTCAVTARLVLSGQFRQVGVCPPEYMGRVAECYALLLAGLAARGIALHETVETVAS